MSTPTNFHQSLCFENAVEKAQAIAHYNQQSLQLAQYCGICQANQVPTPDIVPCAAPQFILTDTFGQPVMPKPADSRRR